MADRAEIDIRDDRPKGLMEAYEDGALTGHIAYFVLDGTPGALVAVHTVVQAGHEGRGIAGTLVREFYRTAAREGVPVVPLCPYAASWAAKHPDESSVALVAPEDLVEAAKGQLRRNPHLW